MHKDEWADEYYGTYTLGDCDVCETDEVTSVGPVVDSLVGVNPTGYFWRGRYIPLLVEDPK